MRFSILTLLGLVAYCAVACMTVLSQNNHWGSGILVATASLLAIASFHAAHSANQRKRFLLGFSIAGWVALVLQLGLYHELLTDRFFFHRWTQSAYQRIAVPHPPAIDKMAMSFAISTHNRPTWPNFSRLMYSLSSIGIALAIGLAALLIRPSPPS